jgi:NAD+-dependent protein deacetylase sirtuin 5
LLEKVGFPTYLSNYSHQFLKPQQMPYSSNLSDFQQDLLKAKHIVVLTGAGISAESGIPTFRGAGGLWRSFNVQDLATPTAFRRDPSLVWEFYHYRREVVLQCQPNLAHMALAEAEKNFTEKDPSHSWVIITQNIDELHANAGSQNIIELHGSLFKTRCTNCGDVQLNRDSPICESLRGKGSPDTLQKGISAIPIEQLPQCKKCSSLLRPHVVWFNESLDPNVFSSAEKYLASCDLCLVVGTSAIVYRAAAFASEVASRGVPVAEFNIDSTAQTGYLKYHFQGKAGETIPKALAPLLKKP